MSMTLRKRCASYVQDHVLIVHGLNTHSDCFNAKIDRVRLHSNRPCACQTGGTYYLKFYPRAIVSYLLRPLFTSISTGCLRLHTVAAELGQRAFRHDSLVTAVSPMVVASVGEK